MRATETKIPRRRRSRHPDFITPAEVLAEIVGSDEWISDVLGSSERDGFPLSADLELAIIRARLNEWATQRLPLFAGRAA